MTASDANHGHGCGRALQPGEGWLRDLGCDADEVAVLAVLRHLFTTLAAPAAQAWVKALDMAAAEFGPARAGPVVLDLVGVLDAVRAARRQSFKFSNPNCGCCARIVTEPETQLMLALHDLRRGRDGQAWLHATSLCDGNEVADVLAALTRLQTRLTPAASPPLATERRT